MKSNFEFLNKYWPALAQIADTAEKYLYSDPNACMYKLGMFSERLVQEIMVFEGIPDPVTDNTQSKRIRLLKSAGLLPYDIDNTLYALRKNRNDAVHAGADSLDDAKMLLSMAYNLAVWFMQTYGDWSFNPESFVLPKETDPSAMEKTGKAHSGADSKAGRGKDSRFRNHTKRASKTWLNCIGYDGVE